MKNEIGKDSAFSGGAERKKLIIRNVIIAVLAALLIAAIVALIVMNSGSGSHYTNVERPRHRNERLGR